MIMLPTIFSSETVIENDNFAVTGLFRIKIARNKYTMDRKIEGKVLLVMYDHCWNNSYIC